MTRFPQQITASVLTPSNSCGVVGIVVALHLSQDGRPYYGTLLGVTDERGTVTKSFESILTEFSEDRKRFPMDYKEPLERCDPWIDIVVRGGREFMEHALTVQTSPFVDDEVREAYRTARNEHIQSTRIQVDLRESDEITVELPLHPSSE
jgi:hypothetical protein